MRVLHDALRPPVGYELDCAVGTTFTLDLISLLSVPLGLARLTAGDEGTPDERDPLALLASIERSIDRVTIFHQAGAIRQPPHRHRELLTLLDGCLARVELGPGRLFHPKVWVTRFAGARSYHHRVVVLSRNLTPDRCWDTIVVLEGEARRAQTPESKPVADFLNWLARRRGLAATRQAQVRDLARSVARARFAAPAPFATACFRPLGIRGYAADPVATARRDRILVVSPFVGDDQLRRLVLGAPESVLVTRPEELARLVNQAPAGFSSRLQLDDALEPEPEDGSGGPALVGLHAKLYCADQGWNATVWTGSANATAAGFGANVEFLVELTGKKGACGIDAVLGDESAGTFASMLRPIDEVSTEPPEDDLERRLDELASLVAALPLEAECEPCDDGWRLALRLTEDAELPAGVGVSVAPLASTVTPVELELGQSPVAAFGGLADHEVSGLFVIELGVREPRASHAFVACWPLVGTVPDRMRAIVAHLVTDRERLVAFLRLLLGSMEDVPQLVDATTGAGGGEAWRALADGTPIFELLVKTLATHPERLDPIARWIPELAAAADGEMRSELLAVWEPVWEARQEMLR